MPRGSTDVQTKACKFCGEFVNPDEFHEEFDFYRHPNVKPTLLKLREKSTALKLFDIDDYAVHRKLRSEHGIVRDGYPRLLNAWKWMLKLIETDKPLVANPDLPF